MLPILFTIPLIFLNIHTYGILISSAFILAFFISYKYSIHLKVYTNYLYDFLIYILIFGIFGARFFYIITEWKYFFFSNTYSNIPILNISIPNIFSIWNGGLVVWGALIGGFIALLLFILKHKINFFQFADICILGVPLAQSIGRLGCIAAGCCWGSSCYYLDLSNNIIVTSPFYLNYPSNSLAYNNLINCCSPFEYELMNELYTTLPLYPVQLFEAFATFLLFLLLYVLHKKINVPGRLIYLYFIIYPIIRIFTEFFRGDISRGFILKNIISNGQFISIIILFFLFFITLFYKYLKLRKI